MKEGHNINAIKEKVGVMSTDGALIKGPAGTQARVKSSSSTEQQYFMWFLMVLPSTFDYCVIHILLCRDKMVSPDQNYAY